MSAQYDLYETPDLIVPENKSLCMPVSFQMELTRRKNSWNVYLVLPRLLTIT